mgnify:FL=1
MLKKCCIVLPLMILVMIFLGACNNTTNISVDSIGQLHYNYNNEHISVILTKFENDIVKDIFNKKKLYFDEPSCGFDKSISIEFDDNYYCIACDSCGIVKLNDKYFNISTAERSKIEEIFKKYGGEFPCV